MINKGGRGTMRQSFTFLLGLIGLVGLVVLLLSLPSQTHSQLSQEQITLIKNGITFAKSKQFEQAQELFQKVLTLQPENAAANAAAYNNLANIYLFEYKYASAIEAYLRSLQYAQTDPSIYLNLGIVYHLQMEVTRKEIYVDDKKITAPRNDWKERSEKAFNKAFEHIADAKSACQILVIPTKYVAEYVWVQELIDRAASDAQKATLKKQAVGTSGKWKIPVYWKKVYHATQ
jgi:tetratricopeptide (TPR) repeat protein